MATHQPRQGLTLACPTCHTDHYERVENIDLIHCEACGRATCNFCDRNQDRAHCDICHMLFCYRCLTLFGKKPREAQSTYVPWNDRSEEEDERILICRRCRDRKLGPPRWDRPVVVGQPISADYHRGCATQVIGVAIPVKWIVGYGGPLAAALAAAMLDVTSPKGGLQ